MIFFFDGCIEKDGRSKMLLQMLEKNITAIIENDSKLNIKMFINLLLNYNKCNEIFINNRYSCLKFILVYLIIGKKRKKIIYDMREYYTCKTHKSLYSRIGTLIENYIISKADIIIVANEYRKRILNVAYKQKKIIVVENKRRLPDKVINMKDLYCSIKNKKINLSKNEINLVVSNGFMLERNDDKIVDIVSSNKNITLTFIGKNSKDDSNFINNNYKNIENVNFVKPVDFNSLSSYIKKFDAGVVNYSEVNLNNKYCASGKIYEFLALEIPVLCSKNPPLLKLIKKYECGISTDFNNEDINIFTKNIEKYKNNIRTKFDKNDIDNYYKNLYQAIKNVSVL